MLVLLSLPVLVMLFTLFSCGNQNSYQNIRSAGFEDVETVYNVVVFANFTDSKFTNEDYVNLQNMLNSTSNDSVRRYFYDLSGKQLDLVSVFVFYNSDMTAEKFKTLSLSTQINFTKQALAGQKIYNSIDKNEEFTGNLDANNDNLVDAITIYLPIAISNYDGSSAAWPHTVLSEYPFNDTFKDLNYNRFIVNSYKYQSINSNGIVTRTLNYPTGVMCHEMLHNLGNDVGIQDLYHYDDSSDPNFVKTYPVGLYDVMGVTDYEKPQDLNAYYKYLLGWGTLTTDNGGETSFSKTDSTAIKFGDNGKGEFFVAQYYKKAKINGFDIDEGVMIYRVDSNIDTGNMYKSKGDQIFIFSKNGSNDTYNFPAIFSDGDNFKNFTYSDGTKANINLKINFNETTVTLNVESYNLEFVDSTGAPVTGEINITANDVTEKTSGGVFIFSSDYITNSITINFDATGYEFYLDPELTQKITSIAPSDLDTFIIKIYVKAVNRNVTFIFKNSNGIPLIDPAVSCALNEVPVNVNLDGSQAILNVKNGDKLSFTLNGTRLDEILITPDINLETDVRLIVLYRISGTVVNYSNNPIANAQISVNGVFKTFTDESGKFNLQDLNKGDIITVNVQNLNFSQHTVNDNVSNLIFKAANNFNSSIIIVALVIAAAVVIIAATIITTILRQKSYFNKNSYFE